MIAIALGCGEGVDSSSQALDFSCSHAQQYNCSLTNPPGLPEVTACCLPVPFGVYYCCPSGTLCCPGEETTQVHCCNSAQTCHVRKNVPGGFDAYCVSAVCGGVPFDGQTQCCGGNGAPVAKTPIANLADCPDRISTPGYVVPTNGCGTTEHRLPDHYGKADFTPACNTHDTCWGTCPNTKQACDDQVLALLDDICVRTFNRPFDLGDRFLCRKETRIAGREILSTQIAKDAYDRAQKEGCQCCL